MKRATSDFTSPSLHHRLAGIPLSYSPCVKTPLNRRIQAAFWRGIFNATERLRHKPHPRTRLVRS